MLTKCCYLLRRSFTAPNLLRAYMGRQITATTMFQADFGHKIPNVSSFFLLYESRLSHTGEIRDDRPEDVG